ncbi:hypothetical protein BK139_10880 [Paenibacillus sp. FSL R5-0490]|uniref:Uncharacterized protein n=1 Tax=Cytobacillus oceanisediminis 2691 TaxID=1196031 RepID=A0A160MD36_9BACI|nr:hypothetical protein A361_16025 [Cytobacillus oceanisediminis 2691]OMF60026.1 hypothetical protein BK139_10880 [Paenibacillus sp. FSL R5-0490]
MDWWKSSSKNQQQKFFIAYFTVEKMRFMEIFLNNQFINNNQKIKIIMLTNDILSIYTDK